MLIINNRKETNHNYNLLNNFKDSDEIFIVSPYLAKSFSFFEFTKIKHLKKITLLTTLKDDYYDQECKLNFFEKLFQFGKSEKVKIEILIDNSLHGKIYICKKDDLYTKAIISSANFTSNGLRLNNEWGICIESAMEIEFIARDLIDNVKIKPIKESDLKIFKKIFNLTKPPKKEPFVTNSLFKHLETKVNPLNIASDANFWLKPIGYTGNFIDRNEKFDEFFQKLHFASFPKSVQIGDILIAYAVGLKKVLSVYKVTSEVKTTDIIKDRWPYYVLGENVTRYYGANWNNYDFHISNERNLAVASGIINITPSGKNSYGNLQRGGDKLRVTKEFGNYLINKIIEVDKDLSSSTEILY